eukprot:scaffold518_cov33-Tisochrysis_lutea.AAC.2
MMWLVVRTWNGSGMHRWCTPRVPMNTRAQTSPAQSVLEPWNSNPHDMNSAQGNLSVPPAVKGRSSCTKSHKGAACAAARRTTTHANMMIPHADFHASHRTT